MNSDPNSPRADSRDPDAVRAMFGRIARRYDLANHLLSGGADFLWRGRAVKIVEQWHPRRVLDLATGSGDLALAMQRRLPEAVIIAADFSPEMLEVARRKGVRETLLADAIDLPFETESFDCVSVAFGLRNMVDWNLALREMARVLRSGGRLLVLDFSLPVGPLRPAYRFYLHRCLPGLASFVTGQKAAYDYLGTTVVRTGTRNRASRQIEEDLRRIGADLSSSASQDNSAIAFAGLSEFTEQLLGMVDDLARNAAFPEPEFERERRQKLEEVKLERTSPGFLAGERLRKVLFGTHPYGQVSASEQQVAAYKREDLLSVYRDFYTPQNALLLLVGDFDSNAIMKTAEKVFGQWTGKKPESKTEATPPKPHGRRVYLVHVPGAVQTQILMGCPSITRKHPDWIKLGLTNSLYGGAFNSRLVMNIREDKGYTYSPRSGVTPLRQHGYFSVSAAVRNDVVAAALTEMFYEMDKLRSLPVPVEELSDAQNYLTGVFSMGLATQEGLLSQLATVALNELPDDYLETYRDKIRALTPEDLLTTARKYFDSANMQIVVVGDRTQIETQAALFGDLEIYDAQGKALK